MDPPTARALQSAPVWVVNCPWQERRWESVRQAFERAGFADVRRLSAVDGRSPEILETTERELGTAGPLPTMTGGERGCALSHLLLCRRLLESADPWIQVAEDDARPRAGWPSYADDAAGVLAGRPLGVVSFGSFPAPRPAEVVFARDTAVCRGFAYGSHHYVMTRAAAEAILGAARAAPYVQSDVAFRHAETAGLELWHLRTPRAEAWPARMSTGRTPTIQAVIPRAITLSSGRELGRIEDEIVERDVATRIRAVSVVAGRPAKK